MDPNRVLDIILESFENKTKDAHIFVPLIESYIKDPSIISEVLSTKLAFLKNTGEDIPASFFLLVAYLLQHSLITLDHIYPKVYRLLYLLAVVSNANFQLIPDEKEIKKHCEKALKDAAEYVRKLQIISINNKEKEDDKDDTDSVEDLFVGNEKLRKHASSFLALETHLAFCRALRCFAFNWGLGERQNPYWLVTKTLCHWFRANSFISMQLVAFPYRASLFLVSNPGNTGSLINN